MMVTRIGTVYSLTILLASCVMAADSWPQFRGDAAQTGVAATKLPDQVDVLWKFQTKDAIEGTAAIAGNTVYVASTDGNVYALDLANGTRKWTYAAEIEQNGKKVPSPFITSPAVKDGAIYIGDQDGKFHCIDAEKGTSRWTFDAGGSINSSANCVDDKVLFGSEDSQLYCFSTKDGKLLWKFHTDGPINSSPAVGDGRTFAAGCDPNLHIINVADGKEAGVVELGAQGDASAAVAGDILYFGNQNKNTVMAVDWRQKKLVWEFESEKQMPFHASAAIANGLVIIGGRDKMVYGLDAKTGDKRWEFATRGKVDSSPVVAGDRVYVGSVDGNVYALDLRTGNKVWQRALGGRITASPAVGQGRLVIGTQDGIVYCLGAK